MDLELPELPDLSGAWSAAGAWLDTVSPALAALPEPMQAWLTWLALVTLVWPLLLIRHRAAQVFLALTIPALVLQGLIFTAYGMTRMLALPHLFLWFPALLSLIGHRAQVNDEVLDGGPPRRMLRLWMALAAATLAISLVFDVRDALSWLYGVDRPYGSRQIDVMGLWERLTSWLEPPAAPEGQPAEPGGDQGAGGQDDQPQDGGAVRAPQARPANPVD